MSGHFLPSKLRWNAENSGTDRFLSWSENFTKKFFVVSLLLPIGWPFTARLDLIVDDVSPLTPVSCLKHWELFCRAHVWSLFPRIDQTVLLNIIFLSVQSTLVICNVVWFAGINDVLTADIPRSANQFKPSINQTVNFVKILTMWSVSPASVAPRWRQ